LTIKFNPKKIVKQNFDGCDALKFQDQDATRKAVLTIKHSFILLFHLEGHIPIANNA